MSQSTTVSENHETFSRDDVYQATLNYFEGDTLATDVWINKYCLKTKDGEFLEKTPDDMHWRLAKEFARIESKYNEKSIPELFDKTTLSHYGQIRSFLSLEKIYNYFDNFKYIIPQGSVMANLGDHSFFTSLSNCTVIDYPHDSYGGICFTDQQLIQLMKRRCGVGTDISTLRPTDSNVLNCAKTSTGAVSFMERFSNTTREVAQSGRRGALILTMDIKHPSIEEFIEIKKDLKKVTGANISIRISDEFMNCVKEEKEFIQQFPIDSDNPIVVKTVNAKNLWNKLISSNVSSAEPGLLFWDRQHFYSTSSVYPEYKNISCNPCSEIAMGVDSCRLITLNMYSCVINPFTTNSYFDYDKWYEVVYEAMRLMDDLVDLELESIEKILNKVETDPEPEHIKSVEKLTWKTLYDSGKKGRRTGLGITSLADTIAAMGFRYDSEESLKLIESIMKKKCESEFDCSIDMSIEKGTFEGFDPQIEKTSEFIQMLQMELPNVYNRMMKFGRRNISISTIAPNGSTSLLSKTSSGVEPVFMTSYTRRKKLNSSNEPADFIDELGDKWKEFKVFHPKLLDFMKITGKSEEQSPYFNCTANDIDWKKRIELQSICQKYITHSISSTINLPKGTDEETVNQIYLTAWEMGLKGITIYVDGSRSGVLVSSTEENKVNVFKENHAPKRPKSLPCDIMRFVNKGEKWIGFLGLLDNKPYEVFTGPVETVTLPSTITSGHIVKEKNCVGNLYNLVWIDKDGFTQEFKGLNRAFDREFWNIGRLISGILRHGMPLSNVLLLMDKLELDGSEHISSWKSGVKRMLKKYIAEGTKVKGEVCFQCQSPNIIYKEGCLICQDCGHSKCG